MRPPASRYRGFDVVLDGRDRHPLSLRRAPPYLRFVVKGDDWTTLDALDQLDDVPEPGERVIVAEKGECNPCHMRFGGKDKHKSGWYLWVKYASIPDQPPPEVTRSTEGWREWCRQRWANKGGL